MRRYRIGEEWHNLRPDAPVAYRAGSNGIAGPGDQVSLVRAVRRLTGVGQRMGNAAPVRLLCARHRSGEAGAARGSSESAAYCWLDRLDDDRGNAQRMRAAGTYLVMWHAGE